MDSSIFLSVVAAAIVLFTLLRKLRFLQDNQESDSSLSPSSSQTPSSVPPSSSSRIWTHHVFPSFRGEDVRREFLSHFLAEFQRTAITPFIDNEIRRGKSIGPELIRAIRESKIAVILISKNYASSKWCLDELVEIMKCRDDELGQTVMPIFYKVDPSDVKKLTGHFGKVFKKTCAGKTKEVTERWKQALAKVATIAGYDSSNWDNEADMIKKIATDISNKLNNSTPSSDFDELIGMRAHLEALEPLLCLDSDEVRMIGIWGPPGIGKTTIARAAYNQLSNCFQLSVFMDNIKVNYTRPCFDDYSAMVQLQQQFMSQITNHKDMVVSHLGVARDRLKDKKVLVVLDGVDQILQLDAMAKKNRWFGPGSRIIITTQDQKLFRAHGINHIYKVDFPEDNDAIKIFCMYAFGQKFPIDGFEELTKRVTMLVGNLPLGLRVMGSYFRGMSKQEWIQSLPKLETSLDAGIESVLRFSYDALDDEDKDLFLHIACFFNGYKIKGVEEHIGKKFVEVRQRLKVLAEKSLIFFNSESYIEMHSLFVKLGREIVRKQSIHRPGQRQFLVNGREISELLSSDATGSANVIGIDFECKEKNLFIKERALEGMPNLQFLRLVGRGDSINLPRGLNYLSPKLQLLEWSYCPMTCLPSIVNVEFLVELNMRDSNLEKLWEGTKRLSNLKVMDLQGSDNLKELPDLSTATHLEALSLKQCSSLRKLPSTIGNATVLKTLDLRNCSSLVELPVSIGSLQKLRWLKLEECYKLEVLPTNINLESLEELDLTGWYMLKRFPEISTKVKSLRLGGTAIEEVPPSITSWSRLEELRMPECKNIRDTRSSSKMYLNDKEIQEVRPISSLQHLHLTGCGKLVSLPQFLNPKGFRLLQNLVDMSMSFCVNLTELPDLSTANSLKELNLDNCSSLRKLPSTIGDAINLEKLNLSNCSSLVELPLSIGNLHKLQELTLKRCFKLEVLPTDINLESLVELDLTGCFMLKRFPEISTKVKVIKLRRTAIEEVPPSIGSWSHLEELIMPKCENLKSITKMYLADIEIQEVSPFSPLRELNLRKCIKLESLPQFLDSLWGGFRPLQNLEDMDMSFCVSLKELPDLSTATNLKKMNLNNCSSLVKLPLSIGNLQKLRELRLQGCSKLEVLPTDINLESLEELDLTDCSMLKSFPEISTNIKVLMLEGTRIEVVPLSIRSWPHLDELSMSYFENLKEFPHALDIITELYFSDTEIQEVPPWIKKFSRLHTLDLKECRNLVSLPQIPDSLKKLTAEGCVSLERLDMDLSNATKLEKLNLKNCSNLVELPLCIGNFEGLQSLILEGCSTLVELSSSFLNATIKLKELDLSGCSSLVEIPLSIGNLQKLNTLRLRGCSKLEVLPTNINLRSLSELDLTDCSMLKSFPQISTHIRILSLKGTAIEEVPLSIRSWPLLYELSMSYFENLKEFPHALDIITKLYFSDTEIQEVPPWVMRFSRLRTLDLKGCRKLVSLPHIPDSLSKINAQGCESLERLDCSFHNPMFKLNFARCFKLNQEARDRIIPEPNSTYAVLPGREVPSYFNHRATCGDCSLKINLNESPLSQPMRFKACFWLLYKGDDTDWKARGSISVTSRNKKCLEWIKRGGDFLNIEVLREHLYTFKGVAVVNSNELVLDFSFKNGNDMWEIGEFGLLELS